MTNENENILHQAAIKSLEIKIKKRNAVVQVQVAGVVKKKLSKLSCDYKFKFC